MKLYYISKYLPEEAVSLYIENKVWKRLNPAKQYLTEKMDSFISAYETQETVKELYLKKMASITPLTPHKKLPFEKLEDRIGNRMVKCFDDLTHTKTEYLINPEYGHYRKDIWGNDEVTALWTVKMTKSGNLGVHIDTLKSLSTNKMGRATHFLKCIVTEFQLSHDDPYAEITLDACTGYNAFLGRANGAYTWARLGFEIQKPFKKQHYIDRLINKLDQFEFIDLFRKEAALELKKCTTPWEIAELKVQDIPIGELLMRNCANACFPGVLYPNFPHSPGMIQYNKRILTYSHTRDAK